MYDILKKILEQDSGSFATSDTIAMVRELADREELRELTARYAFLISQKLSAANLFTEDGGFLFRKPDGETQEARGRDALEVIFAEILEPPNHNLPTVHNHVFSIDGDTATGICWIELHAAKDGDDWIGSGYYEDQFRREEGRWKFVLRDSTLVKWELAD